MIDLKSNPSEWATFLYELEDAKEHLKSLIADLNAKGEIDESDFKIELSHIYSHLNRSWHIRDRKTDFNSNESKPLSLFPKDINPM